MSTPATTAKNLTPKKPGLSLGKLSAVAQIAVKAPQPADTELDITLIYSVKQIRREFGNLEELADSIRLNGIVEPLVVHEEADGRYRIIAGERRFRAAPLAGLAKVPVVIKKGLTELQIRRMQVTENNDRDDLTAYEEAMAVLDDVEQYGSKEARAIWNRSEAWISKRVAVKRYAAPVLKLLEDGVSGDFEVLHCVNQMKALNGPIFDALIRRLREGEILSRDAARYQLDNVKAMKQREDEMARKHAERDKEQQEAPEEDDAQGGGVEAVSAAPAPAVEKPTKVKGHLRVQEPTAEELLAVKREQAEQGLANVQDNLFYWGGDYKTEFEAMKEHMATLEYDVQKTEWTLWQGFVAIMLPALDGIGPDRTSAYIKKLQMELKKKTSAEIFREMCGDSEDVSGDIPPMPDGWHF